MFRLFFRPIPADVEWWTGTILVRVQQATLK